ncbi:hypothetical protein H0H92_007945, partial [Tricholoma furcatifolium]
YHQRLYTLDRQVVHATVVSGARLGEWLRCHSQYSQRKREQAEQVLQAGDHSLAILRAEWKNQVKTQTQPLKRQSKYAGRKVIMELIQLRDTRDGFKKLHLESIWTSDRLQ